MTPARLDLGVLTRRLRLLADTTADLERLRGVTTADLEADPVRRAATERMLQVAIDLAVDINAHIATALSGAAPLNARSSFEAAANAGALPAALAEQMAPAAGLRNVLVHRYVDIRIDLVVAAVEELLGLLPAYVESVTAFITQHTPP